MTVTPAALSAGMRSFRPLFIRQSLRRAVVLGILCALAVVEPARGAEAEAALEDADLEVLTNADCLECHQDPALTRTLRGQSIALTPLVPETFDASVHGALSCVDCHSGVTELVHEGPLPPAQCADCHPDETEVYHNSIHGMSHSLGASGAASCADCHGAHDILPVKDHRSPVFKLNLPRTCANCHSNPGLTDEYRMR
jgi:hypothetical protein